ncbi:MAG: hypothetical protein HYY22_07770 [Thaumarchaeota archaeon]|nr:hypothetical protein [Nitrososphaerota archaeon]
MLDNIPTSVEEHYANLDPTKVISQIQSEVQQFVKTILSNNSFESLLIVGRKSKLLYSPFIDNNQKRYQVRYLQLRRPITRHHLVWEGSSVTGRAAILVDSINTGEEVSQVMSILKEGGVKIVDIYCYLLNQTGTKPLGHKPITIHNVKTKRDYHEVSKKLQLFYYSRPRPIEDEVMFDALRIQGVPPDWHKRILAASEAVFERPLKLETVRPQLSSKQAAYRINVITPSEDPVPFDNWRFLGQLEDYHLTKRLIDIENIQLGFKAINNGDSLDLAVSATCEIILHTGELHSGRDCQFKSKSLSRCAIKHVRAGSPSKTSKELGTKIKAIREATCYQCVENCFSGRILDQLSYQLGRGLRTDGYTLEVLESSSRPTK